MTKHQDQSQIKWVADFIWNIADDRLRDVYVRGKYRDVILPFTVLRRLDAVLESTKQDVLDRKKFLDTHNVAEQDGALRMTAGQAFYNVSEFTLTKLKASAAGQRLRDDFIAYLDGFSPNVQEILNKFKFRDQIQTLVDAHVLGFLIEDFLDPEINLSPLPVKDADGRIKLPPLDNHGMGTVFEELIRRFNEENNEEAGEHFTPRDVVKLMAKLLFLPVAERIQSGTYLLYDGACGTGGMLTVAEETLLDLAEERGKEVSIHLFGQEINPETYAICKADLLLKGEGGAAENIVGGADKSTLSADQFRSREFDFMISNPPYGKSWKTDLERMGGKAGFNDPRFIVSHDDNPELKLITRSSDGQLMFLVNKLSKMKRNAPADGVGSRIALVHNGSALFTGDAGQGESNIRRWVLENDWLEAIIALPLNIFYNTGIATYIWILSNRKAASRRGKVQLIDASQWSQPLRRNLGKKNCELADADIQRILDLYLGDAQATEQSKWFDTQDFGYWKITVERPLRLKSQLKTSAIETLRFASGDESLRQEIWMKYGDSLYEGFAGIKADLEAWLKGEEDDEDEDEEEAEDGESAPARKAVPAKKRKKLLDPATWLRDKKLLDTAIQAQQALGHEVHDDHNEFRSRFDEFLKGASLKLGAPEKKAIFKAVSWRDETAPEVIAKRSKLKKNELFEQGFDGTYLQTVGNDRFKVEYEPDSDLRDTEQVPLKELGGIEAFFQREVLPHARDAWIDHSKTRIGYEISFARYFYKPAPLRSLEKIRADILKLEQQTEGLLHKIVGTV
ncbi:type I restriction-modification system subunit M [Achromobacter dolens]|uniref:type I restriction-modification system subunit M n=1 Tax=Achromobacter dolens TaxID=1287738 RepID=UPI003B9B0378